VAPSDHFEDRRDAGPTGSGGDHPESPLPQPDSLSVLAELLARYRTETLPGLPPFQGGAAGVLSYDLSRQLESIPPPAIDEFAVPSLSVGLYDVVIAWDHVEDRAWLISQGFPETEPAARRRRAEARLREVKAWLAGPHQARADWGDRPGWALPASALAPQFPIAAIEGLSSNFSREAYLAAVQRVIDYIREGDAFQVNLAQRLVYPAHDSPVELYLRLRTRNPAPFAAFFDLGEFQVVSASPERFVQVRQREVETRPIKGTRPVIASGEQDTGRELLASEKDRAENVMIVDLLRNDLSRVCRPESVRVTQLCGLETYRYVHHLVSAIRGRLRDDSGPIDLVRAAFPGGSITGAPKCRAMEIIAELEPTARGAYCGSLAYFGFDGAMDSSILIRTITAGRGWWQLPVGGGIVAQSVPAQEYLETWHKAEGMLRALQ
jgi:para-aminobenzoate synthetase component 1